jgi:hypothetical protein
MTNKRESQPAMAKQKSPNKKHPRFFACNFEKLANYWNFVEILLKFFCQKLVYKFVIF